MSKTLCVKTTHQAACLSYDGHIGHFSWGQILLPDLSSTLTLQLRNLNKMALRDSMLALLQVTAKMEIRTSKPKRELLLQLNIKDTLMLYLRSKTHPRLQLPSYASTHTLTHSLHCIKYESQPYNRGEMLCFSVSARVKLFKNFKWCLFRH